MNCGVGRRLGSDSMLLWLWRRPEATAPIGPLAWELPMPRVRPQKAKKKKKKKRKKPQKNKPPKPPKQTKKLPSVGKVLLFYVTFNFGHTY